MKLGATQPSKETFSDLAAALAGRPDGPPVTEVVLGVHTSSEWRSAHTEGAVHIPLYDLENRAHKIPAGTVWVHCGYRAAAAASLLESAGRDVVLIDDTFGAAESAVVHLAVAA